MIERTIAVGTHGRYLVDRPPSSAGPLPLLVGFHGYAEAAETQLARLRSIPGTEGWLLVAVQGLHRFYRGRGEDVVAGWMTRQDRELAIADNVAYVAGAVDTIAREWSVEGRAVFAGFSQGVAMAFRAAASGAGHGVIAIGGDVPPELDRASLARIRSVLIARGARDEWYGKDTFAVDTERLSAAGVSVEAIVIDGAHEWTPEFSGAAGAFLRRWR